MTHAVNLGLSVGKPVRHVGELEEKEGAKELHKNRASFGALQSVLSDRSDDQPIHSLSPMRRDYPRSYFGTERQDQG